MARRPNRQPRGVRLKESKDKADNKLAFQIMGIVVGLLVVVFVLIGLGGGDDPAEGDRETAAERRRRELAERRDTREDITIDKPDEVSTVPVALSREVVIALGNEDAGALEGLIFWDKLMANLARTNNWAKERRYENLDEAGQERLRGSYLIQLLDPDYASFIKDFLLDELLENVASPYQQSVHADWGNVTWRVTDELAKPKLDILVKSELLPGRDPIDDAQDRSAWKIVGIVHEKYGKYKSGRRAERKTLGADLGKAPKKKKKRRRGPVGPPESDPRELAWVEGTSDTMQTRIKDLIVKMGDTDDIRAADGARDELITIGKTAIPGLLNSLVSLDHEEDDEDIGTAWLRVQVLREITEQRFGYGPTSSRQGFGLGGMTRATPEERVRAVRRWFGWWDANGATWTAPERGNEEESWEDLLGEDEEGDGK